MKEKILDVLVQTGWDKKLNDIQQIADWYAIEFAKWIDDNNCGVEIYKHLSTYEQLLEIFKKEKGL